MRKYLLKVPSGKITETLAVFVHDDVPLLSADRTWVPWGMTVGLDRL